MGKEEVSQLSQGASSQATQPSQLLAKGQPVESVGLLSTPSLAFFLLSPAWAHSWDWQLLNLDNSLVGRGS